MQANVLIARANSPLSPTGKIYSVEELQRMAQTHQGLYFDENRNELRAQVFFGASDAWVLRQMKRFGIEPFVANQQYRGTPITINDLLRSQQERAAKHNAATPFADIFAPQAKEKNAKAEVDREFRTLFHKLWTKAVGTPDYDKKEWQRLIELLWKQGVKSVS